MQMNHLEHQYNLIVHSLADSGLADRDHRQSYCENWQMSPQDNPNILIVLVKRRISHNHNQSSLLQETMNLQSPESDQLHKPDIQSLQIWYWRILADKDRIERHQIEKRSDQLDIDHTWNS